MKYLATLCLILGTFCMSRADWAPSYNEARWSASESNKPIFALFTTNTCPHCVTIKNIIKDIDLSDFVAVEINGNSDIATKCGINAFPTLMLADSDGTIEETVVGVEDAEKLKDRLSKLKMRLKLRRLRPAPKPAPAPVPAPKPAPTPVPPVKPAVMPPLPKPVDLDKILNPKPLFTPRLPTSIGDHRKHTPRPCHPTKPPCPPARPRCAPHYPVYEPAWLYWVFLPRLVIIVP